MEEQIIDVYEIDLNITGEEAIKVLSNKVAMVLSFDDDWKMWITLFKVVNHTIEEDAMTLYVTDMGTKEYSQEYREKELEPLFTPIELGVIRGAGKIISALVPVGKSYRPLLTQ